MDVFTEHHYHNPLTQENFMSEQAEYEKYLGDLYEMEQKYLRERYPEDFEEQDRLDALEDARDEDGNVTFRDVAKLGLMGVMLGGQKLGFNMGPVWESIKGKGFSAGGLNLADSMKGRSEEDEEIAEEKEQVDVSKADTNGDGFASLGEREIQLALQKNELIEEDQMPMKAYHGGMACGCGGECDGSCGVTGYDEVSGNPIPIGSTAENVRDDIDAKLSTDEYVLPANVVKWHGLKHIMDMQAEAEMGLMAMHMDGLIQHGQEEPNGEGFENSEVSDESDPQQEEAEAKAEASEDVASEEMDIEIAAVEVDDHLDDDEETKKVSPKSKPLPAISKKQKFVFAI